jgi:hypothetical protein
MVGTYGDITGLLRAPSEDPEFLAYIELRVGPVAAAPELGHDGRFFFVLANDPWLLDPGEHAVFLDNPPYRAQRMLYPMLAGLFGLASPSQIVWGLVVFNILAMGLGTWATASLTVSMGGSALLGLGFVLNPGLVYEMSIDAASVLGFALAMSGLVALFAGRPFFASLAFVGAVLTRETMWIVLIGAVFFLWKEGRALPIRVLVAPAIATVGWFAWVRFQLGGLPIQTSEPQLDGPLLGLMKAWPQWLADGGSDLTMGIVVLASAALVVWFAARSPSLLSWGVAGFAVLLLVLNESVLTHDFNLTRAVAPLLTAAFVLVVVEAGRSQHSEAVLPSGG